MQKQNKNNSAIRSIDQAVASGMHLAGSKSAGRCTSCTVTASQVAPQISIAIGHPAMGWGGSEAMVMNLLELLQDDYKVDLITGAPVDLEVMNHRYSTQVDPVRVNIRIAPLPFFMRHNRKYDALRSAFYNRFAASTGKEYDLCISSYNFTDWGEVKRAIHFIADFSWDQPLVNRLDPDLSRNRSRLYQDGIFRRLYLGIAKIVHTFPDIAMTAMRDEVIANSQWTKQLLLEEFSIQSDKVIYPPVKTEFPQVAWEYRSDDFVSIGRIAPEKRILEQIEIIDALHNRGWNGIFHLAGNIGNDAYGRLVRKNCQGKPWIIPTGDCRGEHKIRLLNSCRYALHDCRLEAFGITVAEFAAAGCLPFIPDSGGQTEIVPFGELQFHDKNEAVDKIITVLANESLQYQLLEKLTDVCKEFFIGTFQREITSLIERQELEK